MNNIHAFSMAPFLRLSFYRLFSDLIQRSFVKTWKRYHLNQEYYRYTEAKKKEDDVKIFKVQKQLTRHQSKIIFWYYRSSRPEVLFGKVVLKICSKYTGKHPCRSALRHGCSPVNLKHIFRTPFPRNTSRWLLLTLLWLTALKVQG